jgi:hypothetical protein
MDIQRDFDIVEIPVEGIAAYWLSIHKLLDAKRNVRPLEREAEYTSEPFIRHLLELSSSGFDEPRFRVLAERKRDTLLAELGRRLDLMRLALLDMIGNENPRRTLAKMTAKFASPPLADERALELAQELTVAAGDGPAAGENPRLYNVDHRLRNDQLLVVLLFYACWARKEGKMACASFLEFVRSAFFLEGLSLVADGFDGPFVRKRLRVHRDAILDETRLKMDMSTEMCLGVRQKLTYEDVFRIARAFMA